MIGIDPGLRCAGFGRSIDNVLDVVELVRTDEDAAPGWNGPDLKAATNTSLQLTALVERYGPGCDALVVEWPQVYPPKPGEDRPEDPNDLLPLCFVLHGPCEAARKIGLPVAAVAPRIWTKGTPKKIRQKRWLLPAAEGGKLTAAEHALITKIKPVGLRHNAVDGAHLTKWGHENAASFLPR